MAADAALALDPEFPNLHPAVAQGYRETPQGIVAEVIAGELSLMPRPRPRHARTAGSLFGELRGPFDLGASGPGGWVLLIEPELHLGDLPDIVVPDVVGWRRERFPEGAFDDDAPGAISVPPDWVCEVLSPRTEAMDRGAKRATYQRERVGHLWLIDPALRTLEVFRWDPVGYVLIDVWDGEARVRAEPFEAIELRLGSLWPGTSSLRE